MTTIRTATRDDERLLAALDRMTWSPAVAPGPLWDEHADFFAKDPRRTSSWPSSTARWWAT
ncbi:hypothetical protein [Geodermatophilus obscurus]|uniref:hypothetical protein n=1 Tax=Geodermatophilus obscurus TaxID=1861 RepID=UPI0015881611|nr:hypothetical protein [Geodermatophilus obscurus]